MSQKKITPKYSESEYKVLPVYNELKDSDNKTDTDDDLVIMDITMLKGKRVKRVNPVSRYKKQSVSQKSEKDNDAPIIMDVNISKKHDIRTINPISKHGCYSDLLLKKREEEISEHLKADLEKSNTIVSKLRKNMSRFSWVRNIVDLYHSFIIRKWAKEIFFIAIVALFASAISVFIDTKSHNISQDIISDRLDRLIRAVQMDWGR